MHDSSKCPLWLSRAHPCATLAQATNCVNMQLINVLGNGTSNDLDQFERQWRSTVAVTNRFWYLGLADMSIIEAFIHGTAHLLANDGA